MSEKPKFNVQWHSGGIICSVCKMKKNISEDRYATLQKKNAINNYQCRECRKKTK